MATLQSLAPSYPEFFLALACLSSILLLCRRRRNTTVPRNWPLLGMFPGMLTQLHRLHDWATELLRETGCTFLFRGPWLAGMDLLATCDPANINHIFNTHFANYPKGEDYSEIFDIFGGGIFNADSDSWKSQRKTAHGLISDHRFRQFVARTSREKVRSGLVPLLEHTASCGSVLDLQDVFLRFTFDTTSILVLGVDPRCLSDGFPVVPFAKAMDDAMETLLFRHAVPKSWWKLLRWLRLGEEKKMAAALETIDRFLAEHISNRMAELSKICEDKGAVADDEEAPASAPVPTDLLSSYLGGRPEAGDVAVDSKKFLRDATLNFMIAGRDTTGAALSWFFWLVAKNPHVEEKIQEELRVVDKSRVTAEAESGDLVFFEADWLEASVYLQAALCEALRLFPPVPFEHKGVVSPDVLPSGERVDSTVKILFSLYSMGRMEGVWGKDCSEFRPERWISERGRLRHEPSYKFLSFNSGPRSCLGKDMAFTQMKMVAATMIYNFQVELVEGHVVEPKLSILLHMKNGLMVRVRKRRSF